MVVEECVTRFDLHYYEMYSCIHKMKKKLFLLLSSLGFSPKEFILEIKHSLKCF